MNQMVKRHRHDLGAIARRAMIERGLLPDFSPAVMAETAGLPEPALLLESRIGERFEGIVTGASEEGTWVRVIRPPVEGRVIAGFEGLDVGQKVGVELVRTDVERGFIDFTHRPMAEHSIPARSGPGAERKGP